MNTATKPRSVTLETPIQRDGKTITTILIRKPNAGALRGLVLSELLQMKVDAVIAIGPRITDPTILKEEMANMDPADLVSVGSAVVDFLLPKDMKDDFQTA